MLTLKITDGLHVLTHRGPRELRNQIALFLVSAVCCAFSAVGCINESDETIDRERAGEEVSSGEVMVVDRGGEETGGVTGGERSRGGEGAGMVGDHDMAIIEEADLALPSDMTAGIDGLSPDMMREGNVDMMLIELIDMELEPDLAFAFDMEPEVDMTVISPPIQCEIEIQLDAPSLQSFHYHLDSPQVSGRVLSQRAQPLSEVNVTLLDRFGNRIAQTVADPMGEFTIDTAGLPLPLGLQEPQLRISLGEQACLESATLNFYLCGQQVREDFTVLPEAWSLSGDAVWDPEGWLEMTGILQGQGGAAYNNAESIQSGIASIEFTLTTGGGINGGADGFAFSIAELEDSDALTALINAANNGGGLGYAVGGAHAEPDYQLPGDMLTVEIDTWYNSISGNRHSDPTRQNHIAITRNGDPGDHIAWFEVAQIEDLQPHIVRVEFVEGAMRIFFDGTLVIEQVINFTFKGGYMFFSGSTGWATNYHRFDDLHILHDCQ